VTAILSALSEVPFYLSSGGIGIADKFGVATTFRIAMEARHDEPI
jgi:hypothetical protein